MMNLTTILTFYCVIQYEINYNIHFTEMLLKTIDVINNNNFHLKVILTQRFLYSYIYINICFK